MIREKEVGAQSGGLMFLVWTLILFGSIWALVASAQNGMPGGVIGSVLMMVVAIIGYLGLTAVNPNESQVVQLFGSYQGTLRTPGFWWVFPLCSRRKISVRVRNFESAKL